MQYKLLENVLPLDTCTLITAYLLKYPKLNSDFKNPNDGLVNFDHSPSYGDLPYVQVLLPIVKPILENVWNVSLVPTYSYARILKPGSDLPKHRDRPACEYSITITLGHNYDEDFDYPIYMGGLPNYIPVGGGVTYKGCEIEHWREPLIGTPENFWAQVFLHYVDANGEYADYAWDKRFQKDG